MRIYGTVLGGGHDETLFPAACTPAFVGVRSGDEMGFGTRTLCYRAPPYGAQEKLYYQGI